MFNFSVLLIAVWAATAVGNHHHVAHSGGDSGGHHHGGDVGGHHHGGDGGSHHHHGGDGGIHHGHYGHHDGGIFGGHNHRYKNPWFGRGSGGMTNLFANLAIPATFESSSFDNSIVNPYGAGWCCQGVQAWNNYYCRTNRTYYYYCV